MLQKSLRNSLIFPGGLFISLIGVMVGNFPATALPEQTTEEVKAWIQAHPTLRPTSGETLYVQKNDTAAQSYVFQASVFPPGRISPSPDQGRIQSESISMYDAVNGITFKRLQDSLRIIYSLDIYQDYDKAQILYQYPNEMAINQARLAKTPLREALTGELRRGDRYAYWLEIAQPQTGKAIAGRIIVMSKKYFDKIQSELQNH